MSVYTYINTYNKQNDSRVREYKGGKGSEGLNGCMSVSLNVVDFAGDRNGTSNTTYL